MNLADLQSLDLQNVGSWPGAANALVLLVLCAAVLGAGYWFDTRHQLERRAAAQEKETKLRNTFEAKQRKAANLEPLKQQLVEMEQSFGEMLQLLPNKTEIEGKFIKNKGPIFLLQLLRRPSGGVVSVRAPPHCR